MNDPAEGGPAEAPGPLHDFSQSHVGILARLEALRALPARLADPQADPKALREATAELLAFFEDAVIEHHAEEEETLFPAVARSAAPGDESSLVASLANHLTREHRRIETEWRALEPALKRIAQGKPADLDAAALLRLCDIYVAHARFEESTYLPLAARILSTNDQSALALTLHMRHAVDKVYGHF